IVSCLDSFFFFQAEDGIRDFHVTGVQTCALPICNFFKTGVNTTHNLAFQQSISDATNVYTSATYLHDDSKTPGVKLDRLNLMSRSEERRVGKECGCEWVGAWCHREAG